MGVLAPWLVGPIEHVGSTAVPGLQAKPVIDIMAAIGDLAASRPAIEALKPHRYGYFDYKADEMHWFCKPSDAERTHHLHLVPFGSSLWRARLAFRDRLRTDAAIRECITKEVSRSAAIASNAVSQCFLILHSFVAGYLPASSGAGLSFTSGAG